MELLDMAGRRQFLPMVVCCSSRDELDALCSAASNLSHVSVAALYSDLAESERMLIMEKFRENATRWNRQLVVGEEGESEEYEERRSHMIVVTDACLPLVGSGEAVLNSRLLINYELPPKKETYMRRMASCLAADGTVVNMVVGGEVVILKSIEESCGLVIAEMPINIFEMF
ncbi:RNA helicase [Lithospermum erythrorhizon]|uniref:RNA helicase n=1 Tax=Lithospermum erythrorhizon TaxID=34254 RepID=A0AAV3QG26_LITER